MVRLSGTMEIDQNGFLRIGGVNVKELVERYATPLIVFDEEEIRQKVREYREALREYPGGARVLYASKAFANRTLYRILAEEGISLDVVSGGELYTALQAGFPAERIYFHGNNKLVAEIKFALENNVVNFFIDSFQEAELLNQLAGEMDKQIKAMLRLTPGIVAHTHRFMVTGTIDSKFGVGIKNGDALKLIKLLQGYQQIELLGIQAHIGSQIYEQEAFSHLIEIMVSFLAEVRKETGLTLGRLDLGGGLGIPQTDDDPEISIREYINKLITKVSAEAARHNFPLPEIWVEPGRSIIGTAGTTLYSIGMIKEIEQVKKYVTIDGGMTDNIRPALYGAKYDAFLANRSLAEPVEKVTIAGKCCETGDTLIEDLQLVPAETGDILAVTGTGAYTFALANNYNGIPRPAIVLVKDGQANLIVQRESYVDLLKNDLIPEGY